MTSSSSPLKGQMALKSSAFNANSGKLCSQHMVIDHMNAHYKKLLNAKSAIDASRPKAYSSSQKVRDRHKRNTLIKEQKSAAGRRPSSARSFSRGFDKESRPGRFNVVDTLNGNDDYTEDEINFINAMVNETLSSEREPPNTIRSSTEGQRSSKGAVEALNKDTLNRKKMSGDILEKRNHAFTEPSGDFTPRTLKSKYNVPSKLTQSKHYRRAKNISGPPPVASSYLRKQTSDSQNFSDTDTMDETLMSRDFSARINMSGTVPPLDISMDKDHMKWLQEQSARHESSRYKPLENELNQSSTIRNSQSPIKSNRSNQSQAKVSRKQPLSQSYQVSANSQQNRRTRMCIEQEEDELRYLDFINEVTNDILTRGIFTNRVLKSVFEHHVAKNKADLNEARMRSLLDGLRSDLGIPRRDDLTGEDDVGMGSARPAVRSSTKVTGFTSKGTEQFKSSRAVYSDSKAVLTTEQLSAQEAAETFAAEPNPILADIVEVSEKVTTATPPSSHMSAMTKTSHTSELTKTPSLKPENDALLNLLGLEDIDDLPVQSARSSSTHTIENLRDGLNDLLLEESSVKSNQSKTSTKKEFDSQKSKPGLQKSASGSAVRGEYRISSTETPDDLIPQSAVKREERSSLSSHNENSVRPPSFSEDDVFSSTVSPRPAPRSSTSTTVPPKPTQRRYIPSSTTVHSLSEEKQSTQSDDDDAMSQSEFGKTTLFSKTKDLGQTVGKSRTFPQPRKRSVDDYDGYSDDFSEENDGDDF